MIDDLKKMVRRQRRAESMALSTIPTDRTVRLDVPWSRFVRRATHVEKALRDGGCWGANRFSYYSATQPVISTYVHDISDIADEFRATIEDVQAFYDDEAGINAISLTLLFVFDTVGQAWAVAWRLEAEADEKGDLTPAYPDEYAPKWIVHLPTPQAHGARPQAEVRRPCLLRL